MWMKSKRKELGDHLDVGPTHQDGTKNSYERQDKIFNRGHAVSIGHANGNIH